MKFSKRNNNGYNDEQRDRQYENNLRAERRACAKLFNAARRAIIAASRRVDADFDPETDLGWADAPVKINQRFAGYDRDGRNSSDLRSTVDELVKLANKINDANLNDAVATLQSFDVWYGSLCRRNFDPTPNFFYHAK